VDRRRGVWNLHAKGTPQAGATFTTALQPIIDQLYRDAYRAGRREPVEAHAFDALIHLAEHATGRCDRRVAETAGDPADEEGGPASSPEAEDRPNGGSVVDRTGAEAGDTDGGGTAEGHDGAPATRPGAPAVDLSGDDAAADLSGDPPAGLSGDSLVQPADRIGLAGAGGSAGIFAAQPQPQPQKPACGVRPRATVTPRYLALLRVDVQALRRGGVAGNELCETLPCQAAG
jgi:hypothetical protein